MRDLLATGREPSTAEIETIVERITTAPFNPREIAVDPGLVGQVYLGAVIPSRAQASLAHLWKRVLIDEQWDEGTTEDQYLSDIRTSMRYGRPQLMIAVIRESPSAGILTANMTPTARLGANAGPLVFVGYSVNGGMISTGYQTVSRTRVRLPERARWLS
jgi:hypothetical protein